MCELSKNLKSKPLSAKENGLILIKEYSGSKKKYLEFKKMFECAFDMDLKWIAKNDPAAGNSAEYVNSCYQTSLAIAYYRVAHLFNRDGKKKLSLKLAKEAYEQTRIFIHPEAQIGKYFSIDHGTDTYIGSKVTIGDCAIILQDVQIGHPVNFLKRSAKESNRVLIGDNVTICGKTRIFGGAVIESNTFCKPSTYISSNKENLRQFKISDLFSAYSEGAYAI